MRSKYGAKKTTLDGYTFDSKAEAQYYAELKLMQKAGIIKYIELQPRFTLLDGFKHEGKKIRGIEYVADFRVTYADGRQEVIDVKGKRTEAYAIKAKWFKSKYPDVKFKEVKAR